jgi:hypothetical protein
MKLSFARKREGQEAALLRTSLSVLPQGTLVRNTRHRVDRCKRYDQSIAHPGENADNL